MFQTLISRPWKWFVSLLLLLILVLPLRGATIDPSLKLGQVRAASRPYEFDYVSWTVSALWNKVKGFSLGAEGYLSSAESSALVLDYLELRDDIHLLEEELKNVIADPDIGGQEKTASQIREDLEGKRDRRRDLAPFVQEVVQHQINVSLWDLGLTWGGQALPPVLYQAEPDSYALIVSPRDVIRQEFNVMLVSDLTLDERIELEQEVEREDQFSALVVGVGGVGLYPSMFIETGNLQWMLEVIGHEWTHNYLTLHPLGLNYFSSPELRTINETVAELSGAEIERAALLRYYPEHVPPDSGITEEEADPGPTSMLEELYGMHPGRFDFRYEMRITRLTVDRMLGNGNVQEAEEYMEQRRQFFWDHGYRIRKLNQAYFAFHGSYAARPGGAAGAEENRLGQSLRALKSKMPTFASFIKKVAWLWRLDQFEDVFQTELGS